LENTRFAVFPGLVVGVHDANVAVFVVGVVTSP